MDYFGIILGVTLVLMYLVFRDSQEEIDEQCAIERTLLDNRKDRRRVVELMLAIIHQRGFFDPDEPLLKILRTRLHQLRDD